MAQSRSRGSHFAYIAKQNLQYVFPSLLSQDPELAASIARSAHYSRTPPHTGVPANPTTTKTKFRIVNEDTFDCASSIVLRGPGVPRQGVCVLNMANHRTPGGGWIGGAGAQEEALCRHSTLFLHIEGPKEGRSWFPHGHTAGTWAEGVFVFRNSDANGNLMAEERNKFKCNVVSVAAIPRPKLSPDQKSYAKPADVDTTKQKILTILRIAKIHHQKVLVLGAFGCGAFHNPPEAVAPIFFDTLTNDPEFIDAFEEVWFAILDRSGSTNYEPFKSVFSSVLGE